MADEFDVKLKALSFFSGAMGLDLGVEESGVDVLLACEFDKHCQSTIRANRPELPLLSDITAYSATEIRAAAGLSRCEDVDLVVGGPPCQAFSTAGTRRGLEDSRGNVLLRYVELISELAPRYAVLENVRGLLSAPLRHVPHADRDDDFEPETEETPGGVLSTILSMLAVAGYSVTFNLYNAANFGTPQSRERLILICSRDGEPVPYLNPTNSDDPQWGLPRWRTFRDATADLPESPNHLEFPEKRLKYYRMLEPGQNWRSLPTNLQREALGGSFFAGGGKTGFLRRLAWDRPSPTLLTHPAMPATDLAHPVRDRPLSIEEYMRIQGFPDDWIVEGPLLARYKQIGNAVPIPLGRAVGRAIVCHASGRAESPPAGFAFSRYRATSSESWNDPLATQAPTRQLELIPA